MKITFIETSDSFDFNLEPENKEEAASLLRLERHLLMHLTRSMNIAITSLTTLKFQK
jgi:hypothetical protein